MKIACVTGSRGDRSAIDMVRSELCGAGHDAQLVSLVVPETLVVLRADAAKYAAAAAAAVASEVSTSADLVVVGGDRYEILGAAVGAYVGGVPIAHLSGGDVTEGSADDQMRNAISMLAWLHFPTHKLAALRLRSMAVRGDVHCVGAPQIDRLIGTDVSRVTLPGIIPANWSARNILVVLHPATLERDRDTCTETVVALHRILRDLDDISAFVIGPNADPGNVKVRAMLHALCQDAPRAVYLDGLAPEVYLYMLKACDCLVGNSSSGIYEAPYYGTPVVNVGSRQSGRPRADCVQSTPSMAAHVDQMIQRVLEQGRYPVEMPFGEGRSARRIAEIITEWGRNRERAKVGMARPAFAEGMGPLA